MSPVRADLRILLVSADPEVQKNISDLLLTQSWKVTTASTGQEAVRRFQSESWDLVLMAVRLPDLDGFVVTQTIRDSEIRSGGQVPVIGLSADGSEAERRRALEAGMNDYLVNPLLLRELLKAIDRNLAILPLAAPSKDDIPFDLSGLLADLEGDRALLDHLARVLVSGFPQTRREINEALREGNAERLMRAAHNLRGALGNFKAMDGFVLAEQLEQAGRQRQLSGADAVWKKLEAEISRIEAYFGVGMPLPSSK